MCRFCGGELFIKIVEGIEAAEGEEVVVVDSDL